MWGLRAFLEGYQKPCHHLRHAGKKKTKQKSLSQKCMQRLCQAWKNAEVVQSKSTKRDIGREPVSHSMTDQAASPSNSHMFFQTICWPMAAWRSQSAFTILACRPCFAASSENDFHSFCSGSLVPETR